jgi:hypothetical protein
MAAWSRSRITFRYRSRPPMFDSMLRKQDHFLPRLAAVRQRDQAGGLQLVERGEQFVDAGRFACDAGFRERRLRIPQPGLHVDVHRRGVPVALDLDDADDGFGQQLVPVLAARDVVDVVEHVFLDDVEELLGGVELGGGGRIAADDAVDGDGARLVAAGDGAVDPGAAGVAVGLGDLRTAADSPPEVHQWITSALSPLWRPGGAGAFFIRSRHAMETFPWACSDYTIPKKSVSNKTMPQTAACTHAAFTWPQPHVDGVGMRRRPASRRPGAPPTRRRNRRWRAR